MYNLLARKFRFFRVLFISLILTILFYVLRYFFIEQFKINTILVFAPFAAFLIAFFYSANKIPNTKHPLLLFTTCFISLLLLNFELKIEALKSFGYAIVILLLSTGTNFKLKSHFICLALVLLDVFLKSNILFTYASFAFAVFTQPRLFIQMVIQYVIIFILALELSFLFGFSDFDFQKFIPILSSQYLNIQEVIILIVVIFWVLLFWMSNFKYVYSRNIEKNKIFQPFFLLIFVYLFVFFSKTHDENAWMLMLTISPLVSATFDEIKRTWIKELLVWLLLVSFSMFSIQNIFDKPSFL